MVDAATRTDSLSTNNVDKPNELTQTEKEKFLAYMMDKFGLTEEQANRMLANLSPEEVQTYLGLASGKDTITRDEAKKTLGSYRRRGGHSFRRFRKDRDSHQSFRRRIS